jgi:hypothetical protein
MAIAADTIRMTLSNLDDKFRKELAMMIERLDPSTTMTVEECRALQDLALRHHWGEKYNLMISTPPEWCSRQKRFFVLHIGASNYSWEAELDDEHFFPPNYDQYERRLSLEHLQAAPDVHAKFARFFEAIDSVTERKDQVIGNLKQFLNDSPSVVKAVRDLPQIHEFLPWQVRDKLEKPKHKDDDLVMSLREEITRVNTVVQISGV